MNKIDRQRRKWLMMGSAALGLSFFPAIATASSASANKHQARTLLIRNINTNETIQSTYFDGKYYSQPELARLNHLFRDRRNNHIATIDPKLYDQLYALQKQFGNKQIELICGYRSVDSNNEMHAKTNGVAKNSYHTLGQAADIRFVDVPLKTVCDAALNLKSGGVGYYPVSQFVHVDVGPIRRWSGK